MTLYLDFFAPGRDVGGPASGPSVQEGDGTQKPLALGQLGDSEIAARFAGRDLLFVAHGFNVSHSEGAFSLGWLDRYLNLPPRFLFVGVLWPGDAWLPVVDYPFEGSVSMACGRLLGQFCSDICGGAGSLSFASHSLGGRLLLEALKFMVPRAHAVCLTAGAINRDCMQEEYAGIAERGDSFAALASHHDEVLKLAFTLGDPFADLLHADHTPFQAALGYDGPPPSHPQPFPQPWQIPDAADWGHHDYLPPQSTAVLPVSPGNPPPPVPPPSAARWAWAADFIRRCVMNERQTWPPGQ